MFAAHDRGHKNVAKEHAETGTGVLVKPDFSTQVTKHLSCLTLLPSDVLKLVIHFHIIHIVYFAKIV